MSKECPFDSLVGVTLVAVTGLKLESEEVCWFAADGRAWRMWHEKDCCEDVEIVEIHGDQRDIIGTPIVAAGAVSREPTEEEKADPTFDFDDSNTWTFYRLQTVKGSMQIRWLGRSNGYYSEGVSFHRVRKALDLRQHVQVARGDLAALELTFDERDMDNEADV